jgi:hypothetical protein
LASHTDRTVECPHCRKPFLDDGKSAGQVVCCPHCGKRLRIPPRQSELCRADVSYPVLETASDKINSRRALAYCEYIQLTHEEKRKVFYVPRLDNIETVLRVKKIVADCFDRGDDFKDFQDKIEKEFGDKLNLSFSDLEKVFRGNINRSLVDGLLQTLEHPIVTGGFPYLMFSAVRDDRTPKTHIALEHFGLNGTCVYRRDDPLWGSYAPPMTDLCRCTVTPITTHSAAEKGVKEAQEWIRNGRPPTWPQWVKMPMYDPRADREDDWWPDPELLETPIGILEAVVTARGELINKLKKPSSGASANYSPRGVRMPRTAEEGLALLQGSVNADFILQPLEYYFRAMERASMKNIPAWKGEPDNEVESLETMDAIIACCQQSRS